MWESIKKKVLWNVTKNRDLEKILISFFEAVYKQKNLYHLLYPLINIRQRQADLISDDSQPTSYSF